MFLFSLNRLKFESHCLLNLKKNHNRQKPKRFIKLTQKKKITDDYLVAICTISNCYMTALQCIEHNSEDLNVMVKDVNKELSRISSAVYALSC